MRRETIKSPSSETPQAGRIFAQVRRMRHALAIGAMALALSGCMALDADDVREPPPIPAKLIAAQERVRTHRRHPQRDDLTKPVRHGRAPRPGRAPDPRSSCGP